LREQPSSCQREREVFDAQVAYMMDMMANDPESIARLLSTQIWLNVIFGVSIVILVISNLNGRDSQ